MKIVKYLQILKGEEIARRYFIMNSFDGALTILGIIIGMYTAGVNDARIVVISCLGAAVAMAVSGVWGAYVTERAERMRELKKLERHMLRDLGGTRISRSANLMSFLIALVDGLSPLLVSILLIIPFILSQLNVIPLHIAFYSAMGMVLLILFTLGLLVGTIGKDDMIKSGLKMVLAGIIVSVIVLFLEGLKVI